MDLHKNIFLKILIFSGILLFSLIAYIIIRSTSTLIAIVPNQDIKAGTVITKDFIKRITIASNTPEGFITDESSLIGQKLRIGVGENQLLYIGNIMTSWEELIDGENIPENYVVTSMLIPSERAIGGLITSGDTVDILGVPNNYYSNINYKEMQNYLGQMGEYDSYGAKGTHIYWVLSNVKILETDSTLSSTEGSSISTITNNEENSKTGSYYIVALSYSDYQKLRLSEVYLNFWLSLVPPQNEEKDPLYDQMRQNTVKMMQDSQNQPEDYLSNGLEDIKNKEESKTKDEEDIEPKEIEKDSSN